MKNQKGRYDQIIICCLQLTIFIIKNVSSQDLSFSEGVNTLHLNPTSDLSQQHSKLLHFSNEEMSINQFHQRGHDIIIFKNSTFSSPDRIVPGDMGTGVTIESPLEDVKRAIKEGYETYSFNKYVSDMIPVKRKLKDHRNNWYVYLRKCCQHRQTFQLFFVHYSQEH